MLGWTPNKGQSITGQTGHPRMQSPNQGIGKLDKLSHNSHSPDRLSKNAIQIYLDKRGCKSPNPWTSRTLLRRTHQDKLNSIKQRTSRQAELQRTPPDNTAGY